MSCFVSAFASEQTTFSSRGIARSILDGGEAGVVVSYTPAWMIQSCIDVIRSGIRLDRCSEVGDGNV